MNEGEVKLANRARDRLRQAERDLEQAMDSFKAGRHEWACFAAHQAAEKAVKALHLHLGQEARGHAIALLLKDCPPNAALPASLTEKGRVLDNFYIPARYPNAHPEGPPADQYGPVQSEVATAYAREIIEFSRAQVA